MRLVMVVCFLGMLGMCASAVLADPNSIEEKPWSVYLGDARTEYPEAEPNDTCDQAQAMACGDVITPGYLDPGNLDWYTWSMNVGDQLTCGTDVVNPGDGTDTYIELYANDCVTLLAQDDDSGPGFYSMISNFVAPYTGVYNLKVRGYNTSSYGPYKFYVNCGTPPPPPDNDACSGAIEIPRCSAGSLNGDDTTARNDYDPSIPGPSCTGYSAAGLDVVYFINAQAGDIMDFSYNNLNTDSSFYLVTDCTNVSSSCVAGADDTVWPDPEVIHYVAGSATVYYLILDSYTSLGGGPWTLDYTINCPTPEACCFTDGHCEMLLADVCRAMGGTPQGTGSNCDSVQCEVVATQPSTWGQIKSSYR